MENEIVNKGDEGEVIKMVKIDLDYSIRVLGEMIKKVRKDI